MDSILEQHMVLFKLEYGQPNKSYKSSNLKYQKSSNNDFLKFNYLFSFSKRKLCKLMKLYKKIYLLTYLLYFLFLVIVL
jgi:hypothetical protein